MLPDALREPNAAEVMATVSTLSTRMIGLLVQYREACRRAMVAGRSNTSLSLRVRPVRLQI